MTIWKNDLGGAVLLFTILYCCFFVLNMAILANLVHFAWICSIMPAFCSLLLPSKNYAGKISSSLPPPLPMIVVVGTTLMGALHIRNTRQHCTNRGQSMQCSHSPVISYKHLPINQSLDDLSAMRIATFIFTIYACKQ